MKNALLPERHPTRDFFIPDIFDAIPLKNDRHTMEHPFFTLSTKPDVRTVDYSHNGVHISLNPHHTHGLPTMMDKDILLYLGSLVMEEINKGNIPPRKLRFSAHDLMVATNRHTNDVGYAMLKKAFERLQGVSVTTNIKTNNIKFASGFGLIDSWRIVERSHDKRRMVKLEATLSEWFYNALLGGEVLTINRHYFRLRKPLERRLYELARKHCGKQKEWFISVESLHQKCGSLSQLKYFRFQVRQIIDLNNKEKHFPDYDLELRDNDTVRFTLKRAFKGAIAKEQTKDTGKIPPISLEATERARDIVKYSNMGWDYYALEAEFNYSLQQGFRPDSVDGAFIAFIKKKVEKRA
jgi:plasmid replication initiation protein